MSPSLELLRYKRIILWTTLVMALLLSLGLIASYLWQAWALAFFFAGTLLGSMLACLNVLAMGYAAYALLIKKCSQLNLLYPCASFFLLCLSALMLVFKVESSVFGFACGLIAPLPLAMTLAFLDRNPLDRVSL